MDNPAYSKKHFIVLLSICLMVGSSIGILVNGNGVFYRSMALDLGVLQGSVALHGTFLSLSTAFASLTANQAIKRFGWKKTITFGALAGTVGTLLMSIASNVYMIYAFGIIRGMGSAYFSMVPMNIFVNHWFVKKKGLAIGMASGMSGVIGALGAPFFAILIEQFDWRFAYLIQSGFVLFLALPAILIPYTLDPTEVGLLPFGFKKSSASEGSVIRAQDEDFSPTSMIFIALLVIALLNTMIVFINPHMPAFGQSGGLRPEVASLMLSAVMIGNLVSKVSFGILSEKIGTVKTTLGMILISILSLLILIFLRTPEMLILGSLLFGAIFSVGGVGLPLLTNEFYDPFTANKVYSIVNFTATFGGAMSVSLVGYIYDFTGSYIPAFVIALVFNLVNIGTVLIAQKSYLSKRNLDLKIESLESN